MIVNNKGITLTEDDVYRTCTECNRVFNLFHEIDLEEYSYGHDCETLEALQDEDANGWTLCLVKLDGKSVGFRSIRNHKEAN